MSSLRDVVRKKDILSSRDIAPFDVPVDLGGRARKDRAMGMVQNVARVYFTALGTSEFDPDVLDRSPDSVVTLTLASREVIADDNNVVQLRFVAADGGDLAAWQPGEHLDFHLPSGRRRQYSLCGDPADRGAYSVAVRAVPDGGGGSLEMHALEVGANVPIRGPRNGFPFVGRGSALFIAGGIGITPILAMVRAARELGMDWRFVYSGRSRESMPFLDEIATFDPDRVFVRPDDEYGLPSGAELLANAPVDGAVYCCGPTPMLNAVRTAFGDTSARSLYFERFGAAPVVDGKEFEVQLVSTGEVLTVPADESALTVVRERSPEVAYSCQQGFCGTCRVRVLSGEPDHRERRLTAQEKENEMLLCVSRSDGGRLVLDL